MKRKKRVILAVLMMLFVLCPAVLAEPDDSDKFAKKGVSVQDGTDTAKETVDISGFCDKNKDFILEVTEIALSEKENADKEIEKAWSERFGEDKLDEKDKKAKQAVCESLLNIVDDKNSSTEETLIKYYAQNHQSSDKAVKKAEPEQQNKVWFVLTVIFGVLFLAAAGICVLQTLRCKDLQKHESDDCENAAYDYGYDFDRVSYMEREQKRIRREAEAYETELTRVRAENVDLEKECYEKDDYIRRLEAQNRILSMQNNTQYTNDVPKDAEPITAQTQNAAEVPQEEPTEILYKSLIIENGSIQIIDGDYVKVVCRGNRIEAVPTEKALKASVRRALSNFFEFAGPGGENMRIQTPCIMEKDLQGYYSLLQKGTVYLS